MRKNVLTRDVLISREIEYMIETGQICEGEKLPSERYFAEKFDVNRGTVRKAMQILVDRGKITVKNRSGYYVTSFRVSLEQGTYNARSNIIKDGTLNYYIKLLDFEKTNVPENVARKLGISEEKKVYRVTRLIFVEGIPIGLERTHILCDIAPELCEEDVKQKTIYETLRKKYGIHIDRAKARVTAVYSNGMESELLNIDMNRSVMRYEGIVYDRDNRIVEYYNDIILKEKVEFFNNEFELQDYNA